MDGHYSIADSHKLETLYNLRKERDTLKAENAEMRKVLKECREALKKCYSECEGGIREGFSTYGMLAYIKGKIAAIDALEKEAANE